MTDHAQVKFYNLRYFFKIKLFKNSKLVSKPTYHASK